MLAYVYIHVILPISNYTYIIHIYILYIYIYICHIYFQIVRVGLPEVQPVLSTISLRPEVQEPNHPKNWDFMVILGGFSGDFMGFYDDFMVI